VLRRAEMKFNFKLVAICGGTRKFPSWMRMPGSENGQRSAVVHSLHERFHGKTERHSAHDRRLFTRSEDDEQIRLRSADEDVYWCTADVGWVTGHSYVVYGPLANGATSLMYEGAPNFLNQIVSGASSPKYGVTILYTAPTAIRAFMKWGVEWPQKHDLSSLRLLGSVGEPINPESVDVVSRNTSVASVVHRGHLVADRKPGGIMITSLPGATPTKPGTATLPFFGILPEVVDEEGNAVPKNTSGKLVIRKPWPSMLRGLWGDPKRYQEVYCDRSQRQLFYWRWLSSGQGRIFLDRRSH